MPQTANVLVRSLGDRLQAFIPTALLAILALLTYWLVRNSPIVNEAPPEAAPAHRPDAYFHQFRLTSYDPQGQWQLQVTGERAWHLADTDSYDIEQPRMTKRDTQTGILTYIRAQKARANANGTEVQLQQQAEIRRPEQTDARGKKQPGLRIQSDYLLIDDNRQAIQTHLPVTILRGQDQFSAQRMTALQLDGTIQLDGRVRGTLMPRRNPQ